jgi:hypothetical protein
VLVKYRLPLVSITFAVYIPFQVLDVTDSATITFDTVEIETILPVSIESLTLMFLMIKPLATKLALTAILPGIVPIVTALNTLVLVKYRLLEDSITSDVVIT